MEVEQEKVKEIIKKLFTRRNIVGCNPNNIISINDDTFLRDYHRYEARKRSLEEAISGFNPETDVIVPKDYFNLVEGLKTLTNIKNKVDSISEYVDIVKTKNEKSQAKGTLKKEERSVERKAILLKRRKRF